MAGRHVIDLDPLWRLMVILAALGVIPLLLALEWVARRARDSCTAVLLRSWWRGQRRRRTHRRHPSTPAGPGRATDAPAPSGMPSWRHG
jgi:hypothetical protein